MGQPVPTLGPQNGRNRKGNPAKSGVSPRKLEANRRNARLSTGPRTDAGKQRSRWNALKHGLLSREVVIKAGDGKENESDFDRLLSELREELQPVGILEEILVEKLAVTFWRERRVIRCETGELRKALDEIEAREFGKRMTQVVQLYAKVPFGDRTLRLNSVGLQYILEALDKVAASVEECGHLSEEASALLLRHLGMHEDGLWARCSRLAEMATGGEETADEPSGIAGGQPTAAECKGQILGLLAAEKERLIALKAEREEQEHLELERKMARLSLPDVNAIDKILRYEATLDRQLYRIMNQLERLQRQRRGEFVQPPISMT